MSEHRGVGQLIEDLGVNTQAPQRCCYHDGPGALAGDIVDRIERSVRSSASFGGAVVVLGSLAILVGIALRARRTPVLVAFLAGLAVSLVFIPMLLVISFGCWPTTGDEIPAANIIHSNTDRISKLWTIERLRSEG